jgi:hypothetical protein
VFINSEIVARHLNILFREKNRYAAGTARAPLAKSTMANRYAHRLALYTIPMRSTETTTFMNLEHDFLPWIRKRG